MENMDGQMDQNMKEHGNKIGFKEKVNINGQMEGFIKVNGKIVLCMDSVYIPGVIIKNLLEII